MSSVIGQTEWNKGLFARAWPRLRSGAGELLYSRRVVPRRSLDRQLRPVDDCRFFAVLEDA